MKVKIYTSPTCHKCESIKRFLKQNNIKFEEINVFENTEIMRKIVEKSNIMNLPIIEINGKFFSENDLDKIKNLGYSKIF